MVGIGRNVWGFYLLRTESHNIDVLKVTGLYGCDTLKANQLQYRQKRHNLFNLARELREQVIEIYRFSSLSLRCTISIFSSTVIGSSSISS